MHLCMRSLSKTSGLVTVCLALSALLVLPGCMKVGPDYKPPKTQVPASWQESDDPALVKRQTDLTKWWDRVQ